MDGDAGGTPFDPGPGVRFDAARARAPARLPRSRAIDRRRVASARRRLIAGVAVSSLFLSVPALASLRDEPTAPERAVTSPSPQPGVSALAPAKPPQHGERRSPARTRDQARLVGGRAIPPPGAPPAVRKAIAAANRISTKPYVYGGGHASFDAGGYDCSGAVSYALHGGGMLRKPLASGALAGWGRAGRGRWVTVYAHGGHAYAVIAGLRWDTSGDARGSGPRWHRDTGSSAGYAPRHLPTY